MSPAAWQYIDRRTAGVEAEPLAIPGFAMLDADTFIMCQERAGDKKLFKMRKNFDGTFEVLIEANLSAMIDNNAPLTAGVTLDGGMVFTVSGSPVENIRFFRPDNLEYIASVPFGSVALTATGLVWNDDGTFFVVDRNTDNIQLYDISGNLINQWTAQRDLFGGSERFESLDQWGGYLAMSDSDAAVQQLLRPDKPGERIAQLSGSATGTSYTLTATLANWTPPWEYDEQGSEPRGLALNANSGVLETLTVQGMDASDWPILYSDSFDQVSGTRLTDNGTPPEVGVGNYFSAPDADGSSFQWETKGSGEIGFMNSISQDRAILTRSQLSPRNWEFSVDVKTQSADGGGGLGIMSNWVSNSTNIYCWWAPWARQMIFSKWVSGAYSQIAARTVPTSFWPSNTWGRWTLQRDARGYMTISIDGQGILHTLVTDAVIDGAGATGIGVWNRDTTAHRFRNPILRSR